MKAKVLRLFISESVCRISVIIDITSIEMTKIKIRETF